MEGAQAPSSPFHDGDSAIMERNKKVDGLRKREELEREVSTLCDLLSREEKVHEILEHVHARSNGSTSAIAIPKFVPPKMKELLAELAMVEDEIACLEGQIAQLRSTLKQEQSESKSSLSESNRSLGRVTPSLHFISKAIIGDYNVKDYVSTAEKSQGKGGRVTKSSSPLRDSRQMMHKASPRRSPLAIPLPPTIKEEDESKWEPNKLSEGIMKCLNLIFVRLLRTWRAMEMEKPSPISRSITSSPGSRRFGVDVATTVAGMEPRQQDPYGVFVVEGSIPRDIGPYKNLVRFTSASLNPRCISSSSSIPLLKKLRELMCLLQTVDLRLMTDQQKLAFWINIYNACLMHGFLQCGVPSTPEKLHALINKVSLNIGGNVLGPQAIEHYILRRPSSSTTSESKEPNEAIVRGLYGLDSVDPNVTFALCRGTHSSPAARIYTAEGVAAELERAKVEYLQASIVVTTKRKIGIPELVVGKMVDFAEDRESLVEWVCHQLPSSGTLRKSIVDCLRGHHHNNNNISSSSSTSSQIPVSVEKIPSELEFRYLLAM